MSYNLLIINLFLWRRNVLNAGCLWQMIPNAPATSKFVTIAVNALKLVNAVAKIDNS